MFYDAFQEGPFDVAGVHDKDSIRTFAILFKPAAWTATVYTKPYKDDPDIVLPSEFTGLGYMVKNPGKSGATEPTWIMDAGEETVDGAKGLIWEAFNYNMLPIAETISAVTFEQTNSVTLSDTSNDTLSCQFTIDVLPAAAITAGEFQITAHVVKNTGNKFDVTLRFVVGSR